ncbi:MAG TPA: serine hydrolase domain-containing protein [Streptosporangiaceae bacterium]|nr:serine hydrolase domain-containing protein [Streptosporangiaceae bacterium]
MPHRPAEPAHPAVPRELPPGAAAAADGVVASFQRGEGQPAVAYGIVAGGSLAHAGRVGESWLGGPPPGADTVFRIASMTKSFTASGVLALRDGGALRLDDPVTDFVPELRGQPGVTADSPAISLRHLLTMTAGFPTDDPWGDRQQGTPLPDFAAILARGVRPAWAPGTRFEYSNLGYAVLGRVIAAVAQADYAGFVRDRVFGPLAMTRTGFEAAEFDPAGLARGYARGRDGWSELSLDGYGAFAPMGGVFSCVRDLARWVDGFAAAFPPGGERAGDAHPLAPATRREMQQPSVTLPEAAPRFPGDPSAGSQYGYGFGLFTEETSAWGRLVYHSGGYPGFGSHMRWHPETGFGVVVLANSTYAGASVLAARLMEEVLKAAAAQDRPATGGAAGVQAAGGAPAMVRGPAPAPGGPWPETLRARQVVTGLLTHWDDEVAEQLFADNVALDQPLDRRRERIARMWERLGAPHPSTQGAPRPAEFDSPAHCRWWLRGEHGDTQAEILLTPESPPRVQLLTVTVPPAADSPLWRQTQALIDLLNSSLTDGGPHWPAELPVSGLVDTGLLLRQLRMASAWAGTCRPGAFCGGNGQTTTAIELDGEHAGLTLTVELDRGQQSLRRVDIAPRG